MALRLGRYARTIESEAGGIDQLRTENVGLFDRNICSSRWCFQSVLHWQDPAGWPYAVSILVACKDAIFVRKPMIHPHRYEVFGWLCEGR